MPWLQADVDALKVSIAKGEKSVSFGDRRVDYRSLDEMRQALAMIQAEVNAAAGTPRPKQFLAYQAGKGI